MKMEALSSMETVILNDLHGVITKKSQQSSTVMKISNSSKNTDLLEKIQVTVPQLTRTSL
jgi:hypothetical protein